jgi:cold shock CspA family protein
MPQGTIIRARDDKGFCFILDDAGAEIFANRNQFADTAISFREIEGTRVDFQVAVTSRGLHAERIVILDDDKGREHGTIDRVVDFGGFIEPYDRRGIFFPLREMVGTDWPAELLGTPVSYTVRIDRNGRPEALAVKRES